jgi:predicted transposase/invertase (TIGR01784 family)
MWAIFFKYAKNIEKRELINKILKKQGGISMAAQALLQVSRSEKERQIALMREKILRDYQSLMQSKRSVHEGGLQLGLKKGRLEGEQIGLRRGILEMARRAKAKCMDTETIVQLTGLSEDEIANLD